MTVAKKNDTLKIDLSILPSVALEEMAKAFMFGEKKYGRYNYTAGFESHRLIGAALRHITAYNKGEDMDADIGPDGNTSGATHLGHALASIAMLLHTIELGTNRDTRYTQQEVKNPAPARLRGPGIDGPSVMRTYELLDVLK